MVLKWLRDNKNQLLLAWITALVAGAWTVFVYLFPPISPDSTQTPTRPAQLPGTGQHTDIQHIGGKGDVSITQQSTPDPTSAPAVQSAIVGEIKDEAKVVIRQEQR